MSVTDWSEVQQRQHNLSTYARMPRVWFPVARKRGRTYTFTPAQLEIARRVHAARGKSD